MKTAVVMTNVLELPTEPDAAFLRPTGTDLAPFPDPRWEDAVDRRYCQALMRARRGLVGFGIAKDDEAGRVMFEGMSRLEPGSIHALALCPLAELPQGDEGVHAAVMGPDVVVVEGTPEALMWLLLADLNLAGGKRRFGAECA